MVMQRVSIDVTLTIMDELEAGAVGSVDIRDFADAEVSAEELAEALAEMIVARASKLRGER
jgi:hypothetical protein